MTGHDHRPGTDDTHVKQDRRTFLRKFGSGVVYAAPVITTLAAPVGLRGQAQSETTLKGGMGTGMATLVEVDPTQGLGTSPSARPAPWEVKPPTGSGSGSAPPPAGG